MPTKDQIAERIGETLVQAARKMRSMDKRVAALEIAKTYIKAMSVQNSVNYGIDNSGDSLLPTSIDPFSSYQFPVPAQTIAENSVLIVEHIWKEMTPDILTQIAETVADAEDDDAGKI